MRHFASKLFGHGCDRLSPIRISQHGLGLIQCGIALMGDYSAFTLFALAGYLFAAIFLCAGYYLRAKIRRLVASALVAKGTVISLEAATAMSSDSLQQVFHPVFSFRDTQGVEHRVRCAAGTYPAT